MGVFKSSKTFYYSTSIIDGIVRYLNEELIKEGYEVSIHNLLSGGADISITKGNIFKAIVGMRTALKIVIQPIDNRSFTVEAGVGIFGQQAIPTTLTLLVAWPVLIPQIWGMIQQSKLDEHILELVQKTIDNHKSDAKYSTLFCPQCGYKMKEGVKFCSECGAKF